MASNVTSTQGVPQEPIPAVQPTADPNAGPSSAAGSALIRTEADLKNIAPPLYDAITMAIAMQIKREDDNINARRKQRLREQQRG